MSKADEEKAREIARGIPGRDVDDEAAEKLISAALSQARAEAYADAATVARGTTNFDDDLQRLGVGVTCGERIARAIEAKAKDGAPHLDNNSERS